MGWRNIKLAETHRKMSRTARYLDPESINGKLTKMKDQRRHEQLGLMRGMRFAAGE